MYIYKHTRLYIIIFIKISKQEQPQEKIIITAFEKSTGNEIEASNIIATMVYIMAYSCLLLN